VASGEAERHPCMMRMQMRYLGVDPSIRVSENAFPVQCDIRQISNVIYGLGLKRTSQCIRGEKCLERGGCLLRTRTAEGCDMLPADSGAYRSVLSGPKGNLIQLVAVPAACIPDINN